MRVTGVIPTRGDIDLGPIIAALLKCQQIDEIMITRGDTPYNRYLAAARAKNDVILTCDDDAVTDFQALIDAFEPGAGVIVNAMTPEHAAQYPGRQTLLGFGAIFDRALLKSLDGWERDALFYRESDRIFATVNPHKSVFPKIEILPHASAPNRLWKQPDHLAARNAINQRIFEVTGIQA